MASPSAKEECSICEDPLQTKEDIVTTECGHRFHHACARKRVEERHKSDCRICKKKLALAEALDKHRSTTKKKETTGKSDASIAQTTRKEDQWECEHCSMKNSKSKNRCQTCGEPHRVADHDRPDHKSKSPDYSRMSHGDFVVYMRDLPISAGSDTELQDQIRHRLEEILNSKLSEIKCYTKLGIGVIRVDNAKLQDRLINKLVNLTLDHHTERHIVSFAAELEPVSYIVVETVDGKKGTILPSANEVHRRYAEICKRGQLRSCEQLHVQFPNVYKIVFPSVDDLLRAVDTADFSIDGRFARVYHCADCSFFEDVPKAVTEERLRQSIEQEIQQSHISSASLWIQLNKQMGTACVLATGRARLWSTKNSLPIDGKSLPKKTNLTCSLRVYPVTEPAVISKIINHTTFRGKVNDHKHHGNSLILVLSDQSLFDQYASSRVLRIDADTRFHVEPYSASTIPDGNELNESTWYEKEMLRYKADIMQFVSQPDHDIFRYQWNPTIWLKQFQNTLSPSHDGKHERDRRNTPNDQKRHLLRVTVMLNTLSAVRKQSYMKGDQEVKLKVDSKMKTIVYDHRSKLWQGEKLSVTSAPFPQTRVEVSREDCLAAYERLVGNGYKPLLLNMANATSPGGGYRKGDGAQEENLFRRSDYFRSLDVGLDDWLPRRSERFHCSSKGQLDPLADQRTMYPMEEFGAIYTSGLTVFRRSEDTGYAYMSQPLAGVCALAMAAYRDPKLEGNMLATKYAVRTRKKIENVFAIAVQQNHDSLVLSALGCGAFKNPPDHVVQLFNSVIDQYAGFFKMIVFAIIDDHNSGQNLNREGNVKPFQVVLDGLVVPALSPRKRPNTMFGPYPLLSDDVLVGDVRIFDKMPCNYGATCKDLDNPKHAKDYSHPALCPRAVSTGTCAFQENAVHMQSFVHRRRCQYGGECRQINDGKHARDYEHPSFCPQGGHCEDMEVKHLQQYRHLPLCPDEKKCVDFKKHSAAHCQAFRHCTLACRYGNHCGGLHDRAHQEKFTHPYSAPCPWTPFLCKFYLELNSDDRHLQLLPETQQHCLDYSHVCRWGRECPDKTEIHWNNSIHIARQLCPEGDQCKKLSNEDHLGSFTHPQIPDIRQLCKHADECTRRRELKHIIQFRHASKYEHSGILRYFNLNQDIDFVRNQRTSIERIQAYVQSNKWQPLRSGNIPRDIINWCRTVQPIHRCNPMIFESILLHGHVMSSEYMRHLKDPRFVANSVLQHSRIRRIRMLQEKTLADNAKQFIIAVVTERFDEAGFFDFLETMAKTDDPTATKPAFDRSLSYKEIIRTQETRLVAAIEQKNLNAIRDKAVQIANASINLYTNSPGIRFPKDKELGTDRTVFSVLGPHLGHYYGDVFIVFKRAILHHPDANFSIQAATSFPSGNGFDMRPWLRPDPGALDERIKLYHQSKFNASIPGFEYATALELIALTSYYFKLNTMDIDLSKILERWMQVDSHTNIEAHLPQLIPLNYIDHIYIPKNLYDALSPASHQSIKANFKHRITIVPHDGLANQPGGPRGPTPSSQSRSDHQNFVVQRMTEQFLEFTKQPPSRPVRGTAITIASTDFTDNYVLPLTISQAYEQLCFAKKHPPSNQSIYLYWQVADGDMILTLANEPIESNQTQPHLRCLSCYIARKPVHNDSSYHEQYSYVNNSPPFKHHALKQNDNFAAKSNRFFIGCNTDDFMTFCLEIQRSTGTVKLSHAGPNAIYNHAVMTHTFDPSKLDLSKLNFVHVSAGAHTVPVRNLMICFEKEHDLHPKFDRNFRAAGPTAATDDDRKKSPDAPDDAAVKLTPCRDNVNCLLQYKMDHTRQYSHPCRFSELCTKMEPHLTHEPHRVPKCKDDAKCTRVTDPLHRAKFRHTDLSDYLVPCQNQAACSDNTVPHRTKYSHGEQVL